MVVEFEKQGPVAIITLNRPEARTAVVPTDQVMVEALWRAGGKECQVIAQTEDYKEGPKAFIEKRPPVWKGH